MVLEAVRRDIPAPFSFGGVCASADGYRVGERQRTQEMYYRYVVLKTGPTVLTSISRII